MRNAKQKAVQQHYPSNETNAETAQQYFQITVNVIEARKLSWTNPHLANSYAIAMLGKKKHRTGVRRNMLEPFYKEYFVFELYESIINMQEQSIWLAVMEPRCCAPPRMIGETSIDLGTVWRQPDHQVFHKWAQLSTPRDPAAGVVGFLKVDISIIFRGDVHIMPALNEDNVEDNLLLPSGSEQQRANYLITVHGAFGVPRGTACKKRGIIPSTFVKVTFCGLTAKTAVQLRTCNPIYSEQISMVEMFPNMNQIIKFEVSSSDGSTNRILGSSQLSLAQISHDGENGFLPTFGPSLLQLYGSSHQGGDTGACYRGSLLISVKTEVPYYQQAIRTTSVEPVAPIKNDCLWSWEDFCIFCPVLEVSMLDRTVVGKLCGVAITVGDIPGDEIENEEFLSMVHEIRSRKLHYTGSIDVLKCRPAYGYLDFTNSFPVLQQATRLPDFRFRMFRNNMVYGIAADLDLALEDVEHQRKNSAYTKPDDLLNLLNKALDDAAGKIVKFLDIIQYCIPTNSGGLGRSPTELDLKQMALQKDRMENMYRQIVGRNKFDLTENMFNTLNYKGISSPSTKKRVKILLSRAKSLAQDLKNFVYKETDGSADIIVWLLNGGSRVAYSKIPASDIMYSDIPEQRGHFCGRLQTIYMKPLKCQKHNNGVNMDCFCATAKIELLLWMGLYKQMSAFETYVPTGYKIKVQDNEMCLKASSVMLECRLFIYQAKLTSCIDKANFTHIFVRVNIMNAVKETQVKQESLAPVWNQVIRIYQMMFTSEERMNSNPMIATVEVYNSDTAGSMDFVGRCDIRPVVNDSQDYEHAPKLQWHDIYRGSECTGQLLISAQIIQVPETLMKSTTYGPIDEIYSVSGTKDTITQDPDRLEQLPDNLVPQISSYKIDVYWWGLRDVNITRKPCIVLEIDELTIKSDIIINKKSNVNFPNGRSSHKFETILSDSYRPPLTIKLCDNSTFGRTLFLGTSFVKNPYKYLVKWLPENQRDSSLRSTSIASSNFYPVTPLFCMHTSITSMNASNQSLKTIKNNSIKSLSNWKRLFCSKEPDEEECALLPMFAKDLQKTKAIDVMSRNGEEKDWWLRYYCSQKIYQNNGYDGNTDFITIYNSELEAQPEFSKFKDWCSTLKLYNGKKTGIPEKDDQLRCGFLKAGIVIYQWPPVSKTTAVSPHGVDLSKGYFSEYPANESTRHLVRVYVVKGLNLIAKEFTGKSDPYVVIGCGDKHLGDRNSYVSNSVNPIFGKMYEFRCTLPEDYLLTISLYNYNTIAPDELIGSTGIDLEDRIYSKHRACVGIPKEYNVSGPAKWRNCLKPSAILDELCTKNHIPSPVYSDANTVLLNGVEYRDSERARSYTSLTDRRQNICLNLLHKWHTLPVCGYHLVPEHVETRSLFNPERSGVEQGKLQLWVDIYPLNGTYIPLPVDITPKKAEDYELRVVVWNVKELNAKESFGKGLADIYVKAWIGSLNQIQYTDFHYRNEFGEANFNWRMIFNFQYQYNEIEITRTESGTFSEYEERVPPILIVQVLDSETTRKEDFIGTLTLDLNSMPRGWHISNRCFTTMKEVSGNVNLFLSRSIRSWWPLTFSDRDTGMKIAVGMIEMELTLLRAEKAILMPVGTGRDPPSPLPEPWRCNESNCAQKYILTMESMFRHGGIEYLIVGAIIIISLVGVVWYFKLPRQFYAFIFE